MLSIWKVPKFRKKCVSGMKKRKIILNIREWVHLRSPRYKTQRKTLKRVSSYKPCNGKHNSIGPETLKFSGINTNTQLWRAWCISRVKKWNNWGGKFCVKTQSKTCCKCQPLIPSRKLFCPFSPPTFLSVMCLGGLLFFHYLGKKKEIIGPEKFKRTYCRRQQLKNWGRKAIFSQNT